MSSICEIFNRIQTTSGTNKKKDILKENLNDTIKMIFEDTYGPQKYFIKTFEPSGDVGHLSIDIDYDTFHKILMVLANREITGNDAYKMLMNTVALYDAWSQDILCRIIDRNLKIGISIDNYLAIVGGKEEKFEVALAESLSKAKGVNPIDGTYFVSRKLDGARCVCFIKNYIDANGAMVQDVEFRSRQNKPILTLNNLVADIKTLTQPLFVYGTGTWVLDGEICLIDENGNENFQGLMKEITRKDYTIDNPHYKIFDFLKLAEFDGSVESKKFSDRYRALIDLDMNYPINVSKKFSIVTQERVVAQDILDRWISDAKENDWEGCMLRKDVPYKRGRSKDLLKVKSMMDAEYVVEDVEYGTAVYSEDGRGNVTHDVVSALVITHRGNTVKVGSGLSKNERISWFKDPSLIIGKTIKVKYFEETKDSKTGKFSLRFPVLDFVYDNGREM